MKNEILLFGFLIFLASCTATSNAIPTSIESQPIQVINGEVDACSLWSPEVIKTTLNITVAREEIELEGATACRYNKQRLLMAAIYTDATLQKAGKPHNVSEWFEQTKSANIRNVRETGGTVIENIPDIGEQAYYVEGTGFSELHFLKNKIEYVVLTAADEEEKLDLDSLLSMARIASARVP